MTSHGERLSAAIAERREEYTTLLRQLLAASEGGEESTQELVATRFRELGCQVETISQDPRSLEVEHEFASDVTIQPGERVSVVGRLPGTGGGRSLVFFAHPDGEPLGDTSSWEHPPFAGIVEQGRIYGWGVADDLMGVATMTAALDAVVAAGLKPKGDVILASTASKRHARGVIAAMDRGYVADAAIYLHPAESGKGLTEIKAFTSGLLRFRIAVTGRPPDTVEPNQTAFYHLAVNPIDKALKLCDALGSLADRRAREVHHPLLEAAIGRSTNLHVAHIRCGDEKKLGIVARECVLAGSITFPPGETMAGVQRQVEEALRAASTADEWLRDNPPKLEWLMGASAAEVPADHPLYRIVSGAVAAVTGVEPVVYPLHSASDIRHPMLHKGIPTVGLGSLAGDLSQAGGSDEWVDLDDYLRAVEICASAILDWCGA
jgi:acetylornithine deacetylase